MDYSKIAEKSFQVYTKGKEASENADDLIGGVVKRIPYISAGYELMKCFRPEEPGLTLEIVLNTLQNRLNDFDCGIVKILKMRDGLKSSRFVSFIR